MLIKEKKKYFSHQKFKWIYFRQFFIILINVPNCSHIYLRNGSVQLGTEWKNLRCFVNWINYCYSQCNAREMQMNQLITISENSFCSYVLLICYYYSFTLIFFMCTVLVQNAIFWSYRRLPWGQKVHLLPCSENLCLSVCIFLLKYLNKFDNFFI